MHPTPCIPLFPRPPKAQPSLKCSACTFTARSTCGICITAACHARHAPQRMQSRLRLGVKVVPQGVDRAAQEGLPYCRTDADAGLLHHGVRVEHGERQDGVPVGAMDVKGTHHGVVVIIDSQCAVCAQRHLVRTATRPTVACLASASAASAASAVSAGIRRVWDKRSVVRTSAVQHAAPRHVIWSHGADPGAVQRGQVAHVLPHRGMARAQCYVRVLQRTAIQNRTAAAIGHGADHQLHGALCSSRQSSKSGSGSSSRSSSSSVRCCG